MLNVTGFASVQGRRGSVQPFNLERREIIPVANKSQLLFRAGDVKLFM